MRRILWVALVLGLCLAGTEGRGQEPGARARELAAHFNKDKHKVKEKRGLRIEVFLEMRGEPVTKRNPAEYTGLYESEPGYAFDLRVGADGSAEGQGAEPAPNGGARRFTLRGARVSGALLTGTKVYEDGSTEQIEAAFINLKVRHSQTEAGTSLFGLGVVFDPPKTGGDGFDLTRLFYAQKH
jgi:hypothetical protein